MSNLFDELITFMVRVIYEFINWIAYEIYTFDNSKNEARQFDKTCSKIFGSAKETLEISYQLNSITWLETC